ncbi:phosphonate C-P lyase system protein PhnG [Eggerthella lenta]|uniref:phosphonate C-P lyase system protein PhnG n=1 Tax=Eggerthella sp. TaxID=1929886 RepID=UPI000DF77A97|nr:MULTISPECIES: phosphonate C-P lyase system protein PhnG [Eggerthella]MDU5257887.1 phosphonate C-P lyase system protein PhnG [Eggerthella sp.]MVM48835.1 phosphonate C-P lyase system protein PhnG [Eggerthella lenta]MVN30119.1 phosphonate C-P lyase system protein PhnG [Eggerthella lenta]MVN36008.1 phosphonate C-P lyase system protein PhnG [Eggerthella lenta]RDC04903.1 phosphonate C-P lyase system protein PhnG [Eggerthella lenta]
MKRYERTRALVEGDPALARAIVCEVERDGSQGAVAVLDEPREELVMVQARETAQGSLFFLGEALTTSCRVRVGDAVGLGLVLGSDRCRAYELAVVDAVFSGAAGDAWASRWDASLRAELARVEARDQREARRTAATKVDFSTMKVEA